MNAETLRCWRCGAGLEGLSLPLSRLDECPACTMPLHVCRMCRHFDPAVTKQCREDDAEEVREKERPNFCDYFAPGGGAFTPTALQAEARARRELDSLFGGDEGGEKDDTDPSEAAESLFRRD